MGRAMARFGYHGKVLHVDLAAGEAAIEEPPEEAWRLYVGGGLLATRYLLRLRPRGIDAFDPANLLVLPSSVMAGHRYVGLPRCTVAGKSPLTGGIGETRCDGPFAVALKGSGVDAICVRGAAARPTVLVIDDGAVSFH